MVITARQRGEYLPAGKDSPAETPVGLENDPRGLGKHPRGFGKHPRGFGKHSHLLGWSKNKNQGKLSVSHGEGETENPKGCLCL